MENKTSESSSLFNYRIRTGRIFGGDLYCAGKSQTRALPGYSARWPADDYNRSGKLSGLSRRCAGTGDDGGI